MLINRDDSDNFSKVGCNKVGYNSNKKLKIEGLDPFIKNLEKHFFSQVTVHICYTRTNTICMVIELEVKSELFEILHHYNKGSWGNFKSEQNSFAGSLKNLKAQNHIEIEVEEFSLFLEDTSIIITKIYDQSISEQLEHILTKIDDHSVNFTKGLTEIPYEIYVPVFEDDLKENDNTLSMNIKSENNSEKDYFTFWGLYFYSEHDARIYDLQKQATIQGSLHMLNH